MVTHILSITLEDFPENVNKLVILCETSILFHLERFVGLSYENGVEDGCERIDGYGVGGVHRV